MKSATIDMLDFRPPREFEAWQRNVHSQCGEDGIIEHLLEKLELHKGYFVEFGAWDGRHLSNCAALADRGFGGCFIEGDAEKHKDLVANYGGRADISRVHALVGTSGEDRLDAILQRVGAPAEPSVLSIDIDGMDYHVWDALTDHRPLVTIVEFNPTIPAHVVYVQEPHAGIHRGASLAALWQLAKRKGYAMVAATELNGIFVRSEMCGPAGFTTYSPQEVKSTQYETALFHGFDGSMITAGHHSLLWHGVPFTAEDLQIFPPDLRRFPIGQSADYFNALQIFLNRQAR